MSDVIEIYPTFIVVDGEKWVIPYDRIYDLTLYDGKLINVSGTNLTLYKEYPNETSGVYPRLVCNTGRTCYIQNSYSSNENYLDNVSSIERVINPSNYFVNDTNIFITALLLVVVVKWVFTRN